MLFFALVFAFLALCTSFTLATDGPKTLVVDLHATFAPADQGLLLEGLEYFAARTDDQSLYWQALERVLGRKGPAATDEQQFDFITTTASALVSPTAIQLLEFSLATHYYAATVETFHSLFPDHLAAANAALPEGGSADVSELSSQCNGVVLFFGARAVCHCNQNVLTTFLQQQKQQVQTVLNVPVFDFDHVHPASTAGAPVVFLYADITSGQALDMHTALVEALEIHEFTYVFRPLVVNTKEYKLDMQGFGVELAIKNTEYSVLDDTKIDAETLEAGAADGGLTITNIFGDTIEIDQDPEIQGFHFRTLQERFPDLVDELNLVKATLQEQAKTEQMNVWDLKDLGIQATQRILSSEDPLSLMTSMSQNFPMYASALAKTKVDDELKQKFSKAKHLEQGKQVLQINGIVQDMSELDVYKLHSFLAEETLVVDALTSVGYAPKALASLIQLPFEALAAGGDNPLRAVRLNTYQDSRDIVLFINDIETDEKYDNWSPDISGILARGYYNSLKYVRKNFYTGIVFLDPTNLQHLAYFEDVLRLYNGNAPVKFGVVFFTEPTRSIHDAVGKAADGVTDNVFTALETAHTAADNEQTTKKKKAKAPLQENIAKLYKYLFDNVSVNAANKFLSGLNHKAQAAQALTVSRKSVYTVFKTTMRDYGTTTESIDTDFILKVIKSSDSVQYISSLNRYVENIGLDNNQDYPYFVLNGFVSAGTPGSFREDMMELVLLEQSRIKDRVYRRYYNDRHLFEKIWTALPEVVDSVNPAVLTSMYAATFTAVDPATIPGQVYLQTTPDTDTDTDTATAVQHTFHVVADFSLGGGLIHAIAATDFLAQTDHSRVSLVSHPGKNSAPLGVAMTRLLQYLQTGEKQSKSLTVVRQLLVLALTFVNDDTMEASKTEQAAFDALLSLDESFKAAMDATAQVTIDEEQHASIVRQLGVATTDALILNGKYITLPVTASEAYLVQSFKDLVAYEDTLYHSQAIATAAVAAASAAADSNIGDICLSTSYILGQRASTFHIEQSQILAVKHNSPGALTHTSPTAVFTVDVLLNPLSEEGQKLSGLLLALRDSSMDLNLNVVLNPELQTSKFPLTKFYRYSFKPRMAFQASGEVLRHSGVVFSNIDTNEVLTLQISTPESWLVESTYAIYDLDNLNLPSIDTPLISVEFQLSHLLLTGQCWDETRNVAPAGLPLLLSGGMDYHTDTIVMKNLGYFQLKANPGVWTVTTAQSALSMYQFEDQFVQGSLASIYENAYGSGIGAQRSDVTLADQVQIPVTRFDEPFTKIFMQRDKQHYSSKLSKVLAADTGKDSTGLFSGLFGGDDTAGAEEKVHVFSIASGHLYERMLKIMMLSVVEKTTAPVKFWLINNFFSPQFKTFIPQMAEQYGFEVELVTYKWPMWLNEQTEKQRLIWGYKILFLDVLFPSDLKRVIYIDADQVVRGDVKELWTMDLEGAPYAYVPFCDRADNRNTETDGFRFWASGYWASHLGPKKYHISALYVVDLITFRGMNAGDTLRDTYNNLSQDPGSLSNLDQDLPNYAQNMVPIFSLPQEWLWCQAWCSMDSLQHAKTIDLCNNPLTKTPKLEMARKLLPEWETLDAKAAATTVVEEAAAPTTEDPPAQVAQGHDEL